MDELKHAPVSHYAYEYHAIHAVLQAIGITIEVRNGDEPGDTSIIIHGVPDQYRDKVMQTVRTVIGNPAVRPLTERVTVSYPERT
jgi:phage-related baseplate assembly protein